MDGFVKQGNLESYRRRDVGAELERLYGVKYRAYREAWRRSPALLGAAPLHLDVDLRDACNMRCATCHQAYRERTNVAADPILIDKALVGAAASGLCSVNFGASAEPLLEPELLLYALSVGAKAEIMDSFVHTNGLLLDRETGRKLIEHGLKHLCVSLDAASPETFWNVRKNAGYERIVANVDGFIRLREEMGACFPEVRVSFCVNSLNIHEKEAFAAVWKDRADLVEFQTYRHVEGTKIEFSGGAVVQTCAEGIKRGMLWPQGDITPCCAGCRGLVFGNMSALPFAEIWRSPAAEKIRCALATGVGLPDVCRMCLSGRSEG